MRNSNSFKINDSRFGSAVILLFFIFNPFITFHAQTFQTKEVPLYDFMNQYFIQEIPIEVSGLPNKMEANFGFESIKLTLHHPRTSDLKIQLQAPDGTTVWVTNRNGGDFGENYINTQFSQYGKDGLINNAKNPFTGNFIPDGQITFFNNGSNPNGTWKLLVEDLRIEKKGFLDGISISFGKNPGILKIKKKCSFINPEVCFPTKDGEELLPDLVIVPELSKKQWQEYASNDPHFPSQIKISVAIANIGIGPLEVNTDANKNLNKDTISVDRRYQLTQKIYSLKNNIFSSKDYKTGTIYYESKPGHQHYHVDDWIEMRIVKWEGKIKKIIAKGSKVSYCLFTTGMLYQNDNSSKIFGKTYGTTMKNYGLGDYNSCQLTRQGISVGGYDYYGLMYEGQYLQLPKGLKNGKYILEIEVDPNQLYKESNKKNNTFSMPITISKQEN